MIGLFDSGVGGLSVLKAIVENEIKDDFIYFGDTKNVPYGTKTKEQIFSYTKDIMNFFISKGASVAVMACNTSSALVYEELRETFKDKIKIVPLIQTVAPYFKDETGVLGVLATKATVQNGAYGREIKKLNNRVEVLEVEAQEFVKIVENRLYDEASAQEYVKEKIEFLKNKGCKKIILGCTHFPYLVPIFRRYAPETEYIDPAKYLVKAVKDLVRPKNESTFEFFVSSNPESFKQSASLFFDIKDDAKLAEFAKAN